MVVCAALVMLGWSLRDAYQRVLEVRPEAAPTDAQLASPPRPLGRALGAGRLGVEPTLIASPATRALAQAACRPVRVRGRHPDVVGPRVATGAGCSGRIHAAVIRHRRSQGRRRHTKAIQRHKRPVGAGETAGKGHPPHACSDAPNRTSTGLGPKSPCRRD